MNLLQLLRTPFPRPAYSRENIRWIVMMGLAASTFILWYEPFGIENPTGDWMVRLVIFSLGMVFIVSVWLIEFAIPGWFPRPFQRWTVGKAILWYTIVLLFVGGCQFVYKSWWAGWSDFTWSEFAGVVIRVTGISFSVGFILLGVWQYLRPKTFTRLLTGETFQVRTSDGKPLSLNLGEVLFLASDDNYVDIHLLRNGQRETVVVRSSLKHLEAQLVHPLSPIQRCHRRYLIHTDCFEIMDQSSRKMTIGLKRYPDQLPVSKKYIPRLRPLLPIRPK